MLTGPEKALAKVFGLRENSLREYGIKIIVAFGLSSVLHVSTLSKASDLPGLDPLQYMTFFWVQGACVLVEAIASYVMERARPKMARTKFQKEILGVLRLAWVVGVMYWTAPMIVDELTKVSRVFGVKQPMLLKLPEK